MKDLQLCHFRKTHVKIEVQVPIGPANHKLAD